MKFIITSLLFLFISKTIHAQQADSIAVDSTNTLEVDPEALYAQQAAAEIADSAFLINYIPKYENTFGIEHSNIPAIFQSQAYIPDNFEYSWWLKNRVYLQAGVFAVSANDVPGEYFFSNGFGLYTGATLKLFLFKNAYFTPSWNLYYDQYSKDDSIHNWSIATGPTASFEYFLNNRISLRLDLYNVNVAVGSPEGFKNIFYTVHRFFGLGVRYNFDFKKTTDD